MLQAERTAEVGELGRCGVYSGVSDVGMTWSSEFRLGKKRIGKVERVNVNALCALGFGLCRVGKRGTEKAGKHGCIYDLNFLRKPCAWILLLRD